MGKTGSLKTYMLEFRVLIQSFLKARDFLHIFIHTRMALTPFLFVDKIITIDIWIGFTRYYYIYFYFLYVLEYSSVRWVRCGCLCVCVCVCVCVVCVCVCVCVLCACVFFLLALNESDHHYLIKTLPVSKLTIKYTVINTWENNRNLFHINMHSVKYFTRLRKLPLMSFY